MKRVYYLDFLRSFAIISVVFMHSVSPYIRNIESTNWYLFNFLDSIVRYSVPIFIMISGALLLNKKDLILRIFIKKRFSRILIPTIFWSIIYLLIYKSFEFNLTTIKIILSTPVYYHLWFMYMLISLYIAYPLMWGFIKQSNRYIIAYILLAWFLIVSIEPALHKFYGIHIGIRNEVLTNYMGYFILGYFLSTYNFSFRFSKIVYAILSILLIYLTAFGTELLSQNKLNLYFYGNISPNVIILSTTVYLFFKEVPFNKMYIKFPYLAMIITNLSYASLGIYLLHPIILNFIRNNIYFSSLFQFSFLQIIISWIGTTVLSFLIIHLVRKTPLKIVV